MVQKSLLRTQEEKQHLVTVPFSVWDVIQFWEHHLGRDSARASDTVRDGVRGRITEGLGGPA